MNYVNFALRSRGWNDDIDNGDYFEYYLYSGEWYRIISPHDLWIGNKAGVDSLYGDGSINGNYTYHVSGVQFFSVML